MNGAARLLRKCSVCLQTSPQAPYSDWNPGLCQSAVELTVHTSFQMTPQVHNLSHPNSECCPPSSHCSIFSSFPSFFVHVVGAACFLRGVATLLSEVMCKWGLAPSFNNHPPSHPHLPVLQRSLSLFGSRYTSCLWPDLIITVFFQSWWVRAVDLWRRPASSSRDRC